MKIFIAGAGTMGAGIAELFATAGQEVWLYDTVEAAARSGMHRLEASLNALVEKKELDESVSQEIFQRVHGATELECAAEADWVIEAIFENLSVKQELFEELDPICKPETIFASNTMALSITELASGLEHASRTIGMHFFNPAPETQLVEVVCTLLTDPDVRVAAEQLVRSVGKYPIVAPDYPGFIVNRLAMPQINEAAKLMMETNLGAEVIDQALILSGNHVQGPLRQADRIGLDVVLQILETLYEDTLDLQYRPCALLQRMVQAGLLGCKTGRGFYRYQS